MVDRPTLPFPESEPFRSFRLRVSDLHELHVEEHGNPAGQPVVILHGGPGGGISPFLARAHDPARYRIVLFDQRGCGRSTPHAETTGNTTWDLVADIERIRTHLGISRWQVVGGSWGSCLALAYAITHPDRVTGLILRGIFTLRKWEIDWFYQAGADAFFPDAWEDYLAPIPPGERGDLVAAYHRRLTGGDAATRAACARAWSQWEGRTISLLPDPGREEAFGDDHFAAAFAAIECHYFINRGFFDEDGWILKRAARLKGIPGTIIQGRYDVCTPYRTAWDLHRAWPEARLVTVPDAGHTGTEPGIMAAMIRAAAVLALP